MIKPMLAHKYAPKKITFPCFVQPKLNGIRGVFINGKDPHFQTRYGERWNEPVIAHALMPLTKQKFNLDGEFYLHGMSLQNINSRIGVVRNQPHPESHLVQFCIFDVLLDVPFWKRALVLSKLREILGENDFVKIVKTKEVTSESEADYFYNQWKNEQGFEGMMYRQAEAVYGFSNRCGNKDNRWNYLLKRKEMVDLDATVIGFYEMIDGKTGEGKATLGSFELQTDRGVKFSAGSGLTQAQRDEYWRLGEERMRGVKVRINYEMLSDSYVPLKPIIDCVYI